MTTKLGSPDTTTTSETEASSLSGRGAVADRFDTKGNPLVDGAWYALYDSDEPHHGVLAQFSAEFTDEYGTRPAAFFDESDPPNEIAVGHYECACKQL